MRTGRSHTRVSSRRSSETRLHLNRVGTGRNCNWVGCRALEIHSILAVFIGTPSPLGWLFEVAFSRKSQLCRPANNQFGNFYQSATWRFCRLTKHNRAARRAASRLCLLDRSFPGNEDRSLGNELLLVKDPR